MMWLVRMMVTPVTRDVDAPRHPDAIVLFDVIEKALQRTEAPRPAEQPAVQ